MSKAGDYVKLWEQLCTPIKFETEEGEMLAHVTKEGKLRVKRALTADEALDLAVWIVDVFGEEEQ
jgi:transcriptional regulator